MEKRRKQKTDCFAGEGGCELSDWIQGFFQQTIPGQCLSEKNIGTDHGPRNRCANIPATVTFAPAHDTYGNKSLGIRQVIRLFTAEKCLS